MALSPESPREKYESFNGFLPAVPVICGLGSGNKRHMVFGFVFIYVRS